MAFGNDQRESLEKAMDDLKREAERIVYFLSPEAMGSRDIKIIENKLRSVRDKALEEAAVLHKLGHLTECECKRCHEAERIRALKSKAGEDGR